MTQTLERTTQVVGARPPEDPMPPRVPWAWLVPVAAAVALGATAMVLSLGDDAPAPDRVLVTSDSGTVSLIDTVGEAGVVYSIEDAYAAPDSETIYRIKVEGTDTQIDEIDAVDGSLVSSQMVPGLLEIVAVSPDGDAVALMPAYGGAPGLYAPAPREATSITVARNDGSEAQTYDLEGNFEPETFSLDEDTLFLVEFWPPLNPDRYYVRQLDLEAGAIREAYSPEVEIEPAMRGKARAQVMDPGGRFLYTLYGVSSGAAPLHDPEAALPDDGEYWSFVHVLDLREEQSICVFLPDMFGRWSEEKIGLGISPGGETLYVVDSAGANIAVVDTTSYQVTEIVHVDKLEIDRQFAVRPAVAVGEDGRVFVTKGTYVVIELDADAGFKPVDAIGLTRESSTGVHGIDLSPDGAQLRMAIENDIVVYDLGLGAEITTVTGPDSTDGVVNFVGAPPNTVGRYPLDCAC